MTASWTFLVYLAGFNNLTPFAVKDLAEMREGGLHRRGAGRPRSSSIRTPGVPDG